MNHKAAMGSGVLLCLILTSLCGPIGGQASREPRETAGPFPSKNQSTEARTILGKAKEAAVQISNDFQRGLILDQVGAAQAAAGDLESAVDTANRSDFSDAILSEIADQIAKSNDLAKARSLGLKLKPGGVEAILSYVVGSQLKLDDIHSARRTADQIKNAER